ncbi:MULTISPECIES: DUF3817 domain-containing protein [unclassified Corynebacterium]|uniref:DUF3817 domain-containing protein n=1 Tax=unclassified Corynebacterium TaxID=2624378 RepID=UPI0008A3044F|nr:MULTISPECIES: DUF3817 domain-containing protein [unclassified Corynebacterium]OFO18830.1 hypothetical protein HMPREF3056_01975 [Corynebacterium sp. HMSC056F09]OFO98473.1 hypothetical protein HMPREF3009_02215 [Corynebacterium sp. HMSC034H07]OFP31711.1 hypothetical protein HMPREF2993_00635 [Corynebacterium sp. HMSC068G04]
MTSTTPHSVHRVAAYLEMVTWGLLILSMILKYSGTTAALTPLAGGIHGFGFLCFLLMTALVWINNRWPMGIGILGLVVTVIPFAALPFALWVSRRGLVAGPWRFSDDAEPQSFFDKLLAQAVRHPVRTALIALLVVAVVFSILLMLGPPVDVESAIEDNR